MTTPLLLTVAAYGLLALLLISLNLASRWRWWIKGGTIVVTLAVFAASYFIISGMAGWPTTETLPARFSLLNTQVLDPDKVNNKPGAIYLWVQEIDDTQRPIAPPRAYQLPYSSGMLKTVSDGQDQLNRGEEVMGTASAGQSAESTGDESNTDSTSQSRDGAGNAASGTRSGSGTAGAAGFEGGQSISFGAMPAPSLPTKAPITQK